MRLHELKAPKGAHRERKRIGRGNASGQGTTAGKGTKGQKARSGGIKAGFRGMSSRNQRMAKRRGFTNQFTINYRVVNVGQLGKLEPGADVTPEALAGAGIVRDLREPIKILGDGDIQIALTVTGLKVSATARRKIEAAGGSVTETDGPAASSDVTKETSGDTGGS